MSGLLALLDDVAAIAKVAASSIDDVIGQAVKAGSKAAGAVIDDAAVTPKYVQGFDASRELPVIWRITKGSLKNKLVFLLPAGLALSAFATVVTLTAPLLQGDQVQARMKTMAVEREKLRTQNRLTLQDKVMSGEIVR